MKKKNILLFIVSVSVICVLCFSLASCGGESKTYSVQPSGLTPTSGWTTDALTEEICDSYPDRKGQTPDREETGAQAGGQDQRPAQSAQLPVAGEGDTLGQTHMTQLLL